jgi:hypothetical protein
MILRAEYMWWAPRAATRLIDVAVLLTPRDQRGSRRAEWLGELDQCAAAGVGGLMLAAGLTLAGVKMRISHTGAQLQWLRQPSLRSVASVPLWAELLGLSVGLAALTAIAVSSIVTWKFSQLAGCLPLAPQLAWLWAYDFNRRPGGRHYATPEQIKAYRALVRAHGSPPLLFGRRRYQKKLASIGWSFVQNP